MSKILNSYEIALAKLRENAKKVIDFATPIKLTAKERKVANKKATDFVIMTLS